MSPGFGYTGVSSEYQDSAVIDNSFFSPSRFYDSLWDSCLGHNDDDIKQLLKEKKAEEDRDRMTYGAGAEVDTGGYFIKSPWLQEGSKSRFDQTEKSVDKYLQAVLQKY